MKNQHIYILMIMYFFLCGFDPFRSTNTNVEEGNAKLGAGKIKEAVEYYERAAKELPDDPGVQYNLGLAHYGLGQLDKAQAALFKATTVGDRTQKAKSFYNLGNVQFDAKKYKEAAASFARSLQLNPDRQSAKWNLELALRRIKEEEKKQKEKEQKDKKDQNKNQNKKDQAKNQDKKDDQKKNSQDKNQDKKQDPQQKKGQKPPQPEAQKKQPPPRNDQMNNVLDALDRNDKNLQKQRARMMMGEDNRKPQKDW